MISHTGTRGECSYKQWLCVRMHNICVLNYAQSAPYFHLIAVRSSVEQLFEIKGIGNARILEKSSALPRCSIEASQADLERNFFTRLILEGKFAY